MTEGDPKADNLLAGASCKDLLTTCEQLREDYGQCTASHAALSSWVIERAK